jgi:hypothetical protein
MEYAVNAEHEPTITLIKSKIADLNDDINTLTDENSKSKEWNMVYMKKPIKIKKFNSNIYDYSDNNDKPLQTAVDNGWWRGIDLPGTRILPKQDAHGLNLFPNDIAWWIGNTNNSYHSTDYGQSDDTTSYFYYIFDTPIAMNVYVYSLYGDVTINGKHLTMTPTIENTWNFGNETNISLTPGKNIFEIATLTGLPNSGFVFYVAANNKVLFKSGDSGWGVTTKPVPDYQLITNTVETDQNQQSNKIVEEINKIKDLIASTFPAMKDNNTYKESNVQNLLDQVNELKLTYEELQEDLKKPVELDGTYEASKIQVESNFSRYILYLLFTIFIVGSLVYIFRNPEVGNLDMFIMALAIIIILYYIYEYIQSLRRS